MPKRVSKKAKVPKAKKGKPRASKKSRVASHSRNAKQIVNVRVSSGGGAGGGGGGGAFHMPTQFGTYNMGAPIQVTHMPNGTYMPSDFGNRGNPEPAPPRAPSYFGPSVAGGSVDDAMSTSGVSAHTRPRSPPISMAGDDDEMPEVKPDVKPDVKSEVNSAPHDWDWGFVGVRRPPRAVHTGRSVSESASSRHSGMHRSDTISSLSTAFKEAWADGDYKTFSSEPLPKAAAPSFDAQGRFPVQPDVPFYKKNGVRKIYNTKARRLEL